MMPERIWVGMDDMDGYYASELQEEGEGESVYIRANLFELAKSEIEKLREAGRGLLLWAESGDQYVDSRDKKHWKGAIDAMSAWREAIRGGYNNGIY